METDSKNIASGITERVALEIKALPATIDKSDATFRTNFEKDLAIVLKVDRSRIKVVDAYPSRTGVNTVVKFDIKPPTVLPTKPVEQRPTNSQKGSPDIVKDLNDMLQEPRLGSGEFSASVVTEEGAPAMSVLSFECCDGTWVESQGGCNAAVCGAPASSSGSSSAVVAIVVVLLVVAVVAGVAMYSSKQRKAQMHNQGMMSSAV